MNTKIPIQSIFNNKKISKVYENICVVGDDAQSYLRISEGQTSKTY